MVFTSLKDLAHHLCEWQMQKGSFLVFSTPRSIWVMNMMMLVVPVLNLQHSEERESLTQELLTQTKTIIGLAQCSDVYYNSPKCLEELLILTAQSKATLKLGFLCSRC